MKKQIVTSILSWFVLFSAAQDTSSNTRLHPLTKLDLGLQGVGLTFERKLGNSASIDLSAGIGGGYDIWEGGIQYTVDPFSPAGYIMVNPKIYFNRKKLTEKGGSTEFNAGNYIGLRIKYVTRGLADDTYEMRDALLLNLHWGLQRAIAKRWVLNAHFGGGYAIDISDPDYTFGTIYPAVDFKFSYVLNKRHS